MIQQQPKENQKDLFQDDIFAKFFQLIGEKSNTKLTETELAHLQQISISLQLATGYQAPDFSHLYAKKVRSEPIYEQGEQTFTRDLARLFSNNSSDAGAEDVKPLAGYQPVAYYQHKPVFCDSSRSFYDSDRPSGYLKLRGQHLGSSARVELNHGEYRKKRYPSVERYIHDKL